MELRHKNLIPEFMAENFDDVFKILMPLRLKVDTSRYENSRYIVSVHNVTKRETKLVEMAPELLFTMFRVGQTYQGGKRIKTKNPLDNHLMIDASGEYFARDVKLGSMFGEKDILKLIDGKKEYLGWYKEIYCHILKTDSFYKLVIPGVMKKTRG